MSRLPIGVFDSGLGGLTVVKEIMRLLPQENLIYVGDTARVPYGTKSPDTIRRYSRQIAGFLYKKKVKAIVVACNSASSVALPDLKKYPIPIVGVIEPGAKAALDVTRKKTIAVIGTPATIASGAYRRALQRNGRKIKVWDRACPLFVPLVEEGRLRGPITMAVVEEYLSPLKKIPVDTLVLGCTHYPLLKETIGRVLGKKILLIDSGQETARQLKDILAKKNWLNPSRQKGRAIFYTTDEAASFTRLGLQFLGRSIPPARTLPLEKIS